MSCSLLCSKTWNLVDGVSARTVPPYKLLVNTFRVLERMIALGVRPIDLSPGREHKNRAMELKSLYLGA